MASAKKKNRAFLQQIAVTFREIAALYDVPPGATLHGADDRLPERIRKWQPEGASLVHDLRHVPELQELARCHPISTEASPPDDPAWCEEGGSRVKRDAYVDDQGHVPPWVDMSRETPGVYQDISDEGTENDLAFTRTFARKDSRPIGEGYVYVYRDVGKGPELLHELFFRKGKFVFVHFDAKENRGKSEREPIPGGKSSSTLYLEYVEGFCAERPRYHFYLAPRQLPWSAVAKPPRSIEARTSRLDDWFFTDLYDLANPEELLDRRAFFKKHGAGVKGVGHCVHLVNPLREALRRRDRYEHALDAWHAEVNAVASKREYALAKRVEAFARPSIDRWEEVRRKLAPHLHDAEERMDALRVPVRLAARELVRWVAGRYRTRTHDGPVGSTSRWFCDGTKRETAVWVEDGFSYDGEPHNAYSQMLADYLSDGPHGASDELLEEVSKIAVAVLSRLGEVEEGIALIRVLAKAPIARLARELGELDAESREAAEKREQRREHVETESERFDGGLSFLWEARRKGSIGASVIALKILVPSFVEHFKEKSLEKMSAFLESRYKVKPKLSRPTSEVWRQLDEEWIVIDEAFKEKHNEPCERLELEWEEREVHVAGLVAVVQIANLAYTVWRTRGEHDVWARLEVLKAASEAAAALGEASKRLRETRLALPWLEGGSLVVKYVKFVPLIDAVACAAEVVLIGHELSEAKNAGQRWGHAERMLGATLCLTAALAAAFSLALPVAFIAAVGLVFQWRGGHRVVESSPEVLFLRACQWGRGARFDPTALEDARLQARLASLPDDVAKQSVCLDEIIYDFEPELRPVTHQRGELRFSVMCLSMGKTLRKPETNVLLPESRWSVRVKVRTIGQPEHLLQIPERGAPRELHERLTAGRFVEMWPMASANRLTAEGHARVDVFGDGSVVVEREISAEAEGE